MEDIGISLGRGSRISFVGKLGADRDDNRRDKVGEGETEAESVARIGGH